MIATRGTINRTARLAGALYMGIAPFSVFGIIYVPAVLVVPGDPATTASNIVASEGLFRAGIVSHLIGQTIFIFLILTLYRLLEPVHKRRAVLMAVLALLGVPIAFLNEINNFAVLQLVSGADYLAAFDPDQVHAQIMLFLDLREHGILVAQVFWGLWLLPLGYLVFTSGFIPRVLGVLVVVGSLGYVTDVVVRVLLPNVGVTISQFTFVGEVLLPVWLLFKGVNVEQWEQRALEGAHDTKVG